MHPLWQPAVGTLDASLMANGDAHVAMTKPTTPRMGRSTTVMNRNNWNGWNHWTERGQSIEPAIDRFIARAFDVPVWSGGADVRELTDRAVITVDVPGVKPEQVSVTAEHRTLTVKVERDDRQPSVRQYTIGTKYDISQVQAKLELGVLTLTLPKAAEAQVRTVPVTVA